MNTFNTTYARKNIFNKKWKENEPIISGRAFGLPAVGVRGGSPPCQFLEITAR